nr:hypothetical protein [Lactiplantibacillus carotarum]
MPEEPKQQADTDVTNQDNPHLKNKTKRPKRHVGIWTYIISIVVALGIGVGGTYWFIGRAVNAQIANMQQTSSAMKKSSRFIRLSVKTIISRSTPINWPTAPSTGWLTRSEINSPNTWTRVRLKV